MLTNTMTIQNSLPIAALAALTLSATAHAAAPVPAPIPAPAVVSAQPLKAVVFDPADVKLLKGPFQEAMKRDETYLWSLNPDRFLSKFRSNAGLIPKAPAFGGWESQGVAGQTLGHYLSACARVYRDTGESRWRDRVNYIVDELAECQARDPKGLVAALPDRDEAFYKLKERRGRMIGWVPWYTMHKLFAGLRDVYLLTGNEKAKTVMVTLADWADTTIAPLTDAEMETMLQQEQGGMAEAIADVYALTGNPKYLALARRFCNKAVMDPLSRGEDKLTGLHANTQIPKIIGASRLYEVTGEPYFKKVADTFWESVAEKRSYVIGGHSDGEHFFDVSRFAEHLGPETCETCNTYNMLKLTEREFGDNPSVRYMDFYERGLYNHILASQDPETGMFTYFVPLQPGRFKIYSDPTNAMWCCVGTGMENHTRYNEAIYLHSEPVAGIAPPSLYVNLFIPSTVTWRDKSVTVRQETRFPEAPSTRLTIGAGEPTSFVLRIRRPEWLAGPIAVRVNGEKIAAPVGSDGYAAVSRLWKSGDKVDVSLPMALHTESLPNAPQWQALLYGPIVLSAELGKEGLADEKWLRTDQLSANRIPVPPTPVVIGSPEALVADLSPVRGKPLTFRADGKILKRNDGQPESELTFIPFYRMHRERYAVYLPVYSQAEWDTHRSELKTEAARVAALDAHTVDRVVTGAQQSEVDHRMRSEKSRAGAGNGGRRWRDATNGWFEYTVKTLSDRPMTLLCTYWGDDGAGRTFDILVDGQVIATEALKADHPGKYFEVSYPIPEALTKGKERVVVRFQGKPGQITGGVFGFRMMRPE